MNETLNSDQIFIKKLTEIVLFNLGNEAFGVKDLCREAGMSPHTLNRKLNSINKKTTNQFIREVRLQKAMEMLKNESLTANEIAYKVGFRSDTYFNLCFSEFFGYTPGKARKEGLISLKEDFLSQDFAKQQQKKSIRQVITFLLPWILFLCTLIVISVLFIYYFKSSRQSKGLVKTEKSIAVLPFINNSPDNENIYFINGIMEEVLINLQIVRDLRVISRTSVERFRNTTKSVREIAKKLGVNYIVEGSGQKYGNTFIVSVRLIKASNENQIWGKTFEKEIIETKNIYNIQSEIAQSIASALKASVTPEEKQLINIIPTTNLTAYDFFQRGNDFLSKGNISLSLDMYSKAIREDSLFVAAYVKRAGLYSYLYWMKYKELDNIKLKAKEDIEKCILMNPELPEVKLAQAKGYYLLNHDYDNALKILNKLKTIGPDMAEVYAISSYILRRQSKWDESISEAKRSMQMDPFNEGYIVNLSDSYQFLHQHNSQIELLKEGLVLIPDYKLFNYFNFYGWIDKTADLKIALKESGLKEEDVQYLVYYYTRQYDKLVDLISRNELKFNVEYNDEYVQATEQYSYHPKTYNLALIYYLIGKMPLCRVYADSVITDLNEKIKENPNDERYYATLGKCYSFIGNNNKAVEFGKKGVKMMPVKTDALRGVLKEQDLMEIYIFTGNYDQALRKIDYLLTVPSWLSVGKLMIDPIFDNLRSIPRFQKIITSAQKRQNGS